MSEEYEQVHTTSQEAEPTQPDVTEELDQSTSEPGEEQNADEQVEKKQDRKDPNDWALKRISEVTRARHEAERKAERMEAEIQQYRKLLEANGQGEQPREQQPNIDELVQQRAQELTSQQTAAARAQSVAKSGEAEFPDFMQAAQTLDALGITNTQVQSLLEMEDAHKVIYTLGKNPEEAARIMALSPLQQGRELERLAAKAGVKEPAAVSKAPAPIKTIDGTRATANADPEKMSTEEWIAWRAKNAKTRF